MATKITDHRRQSKRTSIGVGDWIMVNKGLCIIAQVDDGEIMLLSLSSQDCNRHNGNKVRWNKDDGLYHSLAESTLNDLTNGRPYQKVEVELILT